MFNLLVMINCSANFILYSAFSTKFRQTFRRMFCCCLRGGPDELAGPGAAGGPYRGLGPACTTTELTNLTTGAMQHAHSATAL